MKQILINLMETKHNRQGYVLQDLTMDITIVYSVTFIVYMVVKYML